MTAKDLTLEIRMKYDLEKDFDYSFIEVSTDNVNWVELGPVTSSSDWTRSTYKLNEQLGADSSFRLRLRIKSDASGVGAGWDVDSLKLLGPKTN